MSHGSSWDPTHDFYPDRSIFVGNATHIECAPDDDYSEPAIVLAAGSAMGALLLFLMWLSSGLGEASTGERPLATNHFGQFFLIPPFFLAMGAVIGWRVIDCTLGSRTRVLKLSVLGSAVASTHMPVNVSGSGGWPSHVTAPTCRMSRESAAGWKVTSMLTSSLGWRKPSSGLTLKSGAKAP